MREYTTSAKEAFAQAADTLRKEIDNDAILDKYHSAITKANGIETTVIATGVTVRPPFDAPDYQFNEDGLLREMQAYIDKTYGGHYAGRDGKRTTSNRQTLHGIIDSGHGIGFTVGNAIKYLERYGFKSGSNRQDLVKAVHYGILALYCHDLENGKE